MDIVKETKVLEDLLKKVEEQRKKIVKFNNLPADKKVATFLHEKHCFHNHTDACSWGYEKDDDWDRKGSAKNRYLLRARRLLDTVHRDENFAMVVIAHVLEDVQ